MSNRGRGTAARLLAMAALLLAGCDGTGADPEQVATLQGVPSTELAAYAAGTTPVYVRALDDDGDPVGGVTVEWRVVEGGGSISTGSSRTSSDGVAETVLTVPASVGTPQRLEASAGGAQLVFTITPRTPPGVTIATVGTGQSLPPLTALPTPVGVRVTLPDGRPLAGVPVTWITPSGVGAVVVPTQGVTDAEGYARANWTTPVTTGTFTITAQVGAPATAVQIPVTVVAGPPTQVYFILFQGSCAPAGEVLNPPLGVRVLDAHGNGVPGVQVNFAIRPGGSVTPGGMTTNAAGEAVPQWTMRTTPGVDSLFVSVPSMGYENVVTSLVCPGPTARVQLFPPAGDTVRVNVGEYVMVSFARYDRWGNLIPYGRFEGFERASLDSAVATWGLVSEGGTSPVHGVSPGTTRVWARAGGFADTVVVIVSPAASPFRGAADAPARAGEAVAIRPAGVIFRPRLALLYTPDEFTIPRAARVTGDAVAGSD